MEMMRFFMGFLLFGLTWQIFCRVQGKIKFHRQSGKQLLHDAVCNLADIQLADLGNNRILLRLRHLIGAQRHAKESLQLPLQCKVDVAPAGHIPGHDAGGADLHFVEVAVGAFRQIRSEDSGNSACGLAVDLLREVGVGVGLQIDFPQILVSLGNGQLDGCLHGVEHGGGRSVSQHRSCHLELAFKHDIHQLRQNPVLGAENVAEGAGGHIGLCHHVCKGRFPVALENEQTHTGGQDPSFRVLAVISSRQCIFSSLPCSLHSSTHYN